MLLRSCVSGGFPANGLARIVGSLARAKRSPVLRPSKCHERFALIVKPSMMHFTSRRRWKGLDRSSTNRQVFSRIPD